MKPSEPQITGHLDIFIAENVDEDDGEKYTWKEVMIHRDPEGLRSLAKLLIQLADLNQDSVVDLDGSPKIHEVFSLQ